MNRTFHDRLDGTQPCRQAPDEVFFPPHGGPDSAKKAKAICRACPFRRPCLQYALAHDLHGTWGGATRKERVAYQRTHDIHPIPVKIPAALTGAPLRVNGNR